MEEMWFFDIPDAFCSKDSQGNFRWQRVYDQEDFYLTFGFNLDGLKAIVPLEKGECFHYKKMQVVTSSRKIDLERDLKIRDYFDRLRSSAFKSEIKYTKQRPTLLLFWGAGFGHGAGLCQEGAMEMANQGYSYEEILRHYYPAANIRKVY